MWGSPKSMSSGWISRQTRSLSIGLWVPQGNWTSWYWMSLGPRGERLCRDRIREVMFDPNFINKKEESKTKTMNIMIGVLSLAPATTLKKSAEKLFSVVAKIGEVWNKNYIRRQLFGTESDWDWSTKPRSEVSIVCMVLWISWLSCIVW